MSSAEQPSEQAATPSTEAPEQPPAEGGDSAPRKRKRKRRRGRGKGGKPPSVAAAGGEADAPAPVPASEPSLASLAGGLLSHLDDREVPCTVEGCDNTWAWTADEQIRNYGQPPPRRKCESCSSVEDREVPCMLDGCRRTWVWSAQAQLKHRSWSRRQAPRDGKRRRRGDGPPRRKCELCHAKLARIVERDSVCKVHGCTRAVKIDKDSQLRAWAALRTDDLDAEPALAKKMCDVCREFCRAHPDRDVGCGRPGCDRTWTYKTGAQLQAFLAGRFEDPIKLACEGNDCDLIRAEAAQLAKAASGDQVRTDADGEIMPCIVAACEGTWTWRSGMKVAPCNDGDEPLDRMCETHRAQRSVS